MNEIKHVSRSVAGLHRKADLTNGKIGKLDNRVGILESQDVMTTATCNAHRLSAMRRSLFLILGALVSFAGGYLLERATGG